MDLIHIPELDMSIDELDELIQKKAHRKIELHTELMQLEAEMITFATILAAKAIDELRRSK